MAELCISPTQTNTKTGTMQEINGLGDPLSAERYGASQLGGEGPPLPSVP